MTTESATAAATLANRPAGDSLLPLVDSVTLEVVNASTTSAVLRPTTPPTKPISNASTASTNSARYDTRPPNNTSRTPSRSCATSGPWAAGARYRRVTQSGGRTRVAPRVVGVFEFVLVFAVVERARVGGVALQGIGPGERTTEGLRENRVGRFVVRGELPGVAILRRPDALGDERALHAVGTTEGLTRRGVNRRTGHGSRRQPRGAVVVLIGAHVILFRALSKRAL